jgi:hypothetical protein
MNQYMDFHFLQLFAEGGDTGVTAPGAGVQGVKQEGAEVIARTLDTGEQTREAEFQRLIGQEYKDLYDARVQDIVRKRLKGHQETLAHYQALTPALELLGEKYGVDPKDAEAFTEAIRGDEASHAPMTEAELHHQAEQQYHRWIQQAEEARKLYPQLQLEQEVRNPGFSRLLELGLSVEEAFLLAHRHEIIPAAMRHSAKTVAAKLANRIAANGQRPAENGMDARSASVVKDDVSKMSRAQREDLIRRARQGEIIRF